MAAKIEDAIMRAVIRHVKETYGNKIIIHATRNESLRYDTDMMGEKGITDLLIFKPDKILFLELKRKNGKLSKDQKIFNAKFDDCFASNILSRAVGYGYEESIKIINDWYFTPRPEIYYQML